jgi:hypothetical protein
MKHCAAGLQNSRTGSRREVPGLGLSGIDVSASGEQDLNDLLSTVNGGCHQGRMTARGCVPTVPPPLGSQDGYNSGSPERARARCASSATSAIRQTRIRNGRAGAVSDWSESKRTVLAYPGPQLLWFTTSSRLSSPTRRCNARKTDRDRKQLC